MRTRCAAALLLICAATGPAPADSLYLAPAMVPDGLRILPPPPAPGSPAQRADRAIFAATRRLRDTPRWRIATADVTNAPLDRYACAIDRHLTPSIAPALAHLLDTIGTGAIVDPVKTHYHVPRPYLGTRAPICQPRTAHLAANGDYPSGHAANGWLEGLVLAQLFPHRATAILARARAYGESRVICGVHSASAVTAGWLAGSVTFAALQASPRYRQDLDAAARELAARPVSGTAPNARQCRIEAAALAPRPF
ncbi:acid phosphatase [Sphingomonas sp. ASY06-1R]|jgi:acid phosphatase (class A)|uniref:acid phosphatase n=1 Tax=Sphingomonas sp. ASY06-1R TaxID=3445771 RepID=UPI003FA1E610